MGTVRRSKPPRGWKRQFLKALSQIGVVAYAARSAGVSRATAYRHRDRDERFAERWDDAVDDATDVLELEALRRAVKGVEKETWVRDGTDERGRPTYRRIVVREYSDRLLEFLLTAMRPEKYRSQYSMEKAIAAATATAIEEEHVRFVEECEEFDRLNPPKSALPDSPA